MNSHRSILMRRRGFTLVELMIAVALLGLIMTVIFSLFATTSDSLKEADSLADTLDRSRFAMERLSSDVRNAGSFGSPDSEGDKWYPSTTYDTSTGDSLRLAGVASYSTWQNDHTPLENVDIDDEHTDSTLGTNPAFSYDGLIVMGAIDFPQSFEIASLAFSGANERVTGATIPANERGVFKLLLNNPFYTGTGLPTGFVSDDSASTDDVKISAASEVVTANMADRIMRVMDRDGNIQISGIDASTPPNYDNTAIASSALGGIKFGFTDPLLVRNNEADDSAGADYSMGLQRETVDNADIGYDAALIDAFWYHVENDPRDPHNFRLVRERLNGKDIAAALADNPNTITEANLESYASGDKVVITDRVVDFQVWFDCADDQGNLDSTTVSWQTAWSNPDGNSGSGTCMDPTVGDFGLARMAHIRLSVRTRDERAEAPDQIAGFFMDDSGAINTAMSPRYFDVHPDAPGATRVVTVQSDIELANYAMRNIVY